VHNSDGQISLEVEGTLLYDSYHSTCLTLGKLFITHQEWVRADLYVWV
jgi:hypothetical protein